jgi:hypothetical protein
MQVAVITEIKRDPQDKILKAYVPLTINDLEEILTAMNFFEPDASYQYEHEMGYSEQITEKKYATLIDARAIIEDAKDAIEAVLKAMVEGKV